MIAFLKLIRWPNLLLLFFTQLTVFYGFSWTLRDLSSQTTNVALNHDNFFLLWFLGIPTLLITAAGYIINDYFDLEIDKINKPKKVFIERKIPPNWALATYLGFNSIAILIPLYFWRLDLTIFYVGIVGLLFLYSSQLKKMPLIGNIVVACMAASAVGIFLYEDWAYLDFQNTALHGLPWFYLGYFNFAFISTLIREIIKDIQDIRGDAALGAKTYPILAGIHQSKHLISGLFILLLAFEITLLLLMSQYINPIPWLLFLSYIAIFFVPAFYLFIKTWATSDSLRFGTLSTYMKVYMLVALLFLWILPFYFN
jgi:4-hydroxybenzoate polyprenyltransferase